MPSRFEVVGLDAWTRGEREPGGDDEKRWFHAPDGSVHSGHWLFKPRTEKTLELSKARQHRGDRPDTLVAGEDWAEKVSYELATLIGIPAAETELATVVRLADNKRVQGSMSRDMRPLGWSWAPGASLLAEIDPAFDEQTCVGHTIGAVHKALTDSAITGPTGTPYSTWPAFDVWASYLLLDAWIANTDRHAHNWGFVQDPSSGATYLGPSFDHGTSLASGATEDWRKQHINMRSVTGWCTNGRTRRFDGGTPRYLVDIAVQALSKCSTKAKSYWTEQIATADLDICDDIVGGIPNMSDPTRSFARTVITANRKRLCDALH